MKYRFGMSKSILGAIFVALMVLIIVGVDVSFFRNHFWERLMANVGIVLIFAALYLRFLK